jgi:hypothetical protein
LGGKGGGGGMSKLFRSNSKKWHQGLF